MSDMYSSRLGPAAGLGMPGPVAVTAGAHRQPATAPTSSPSTPPSRSAGAPASASARHLLADRRPAPPRRPAAHLHPGRHPPSKSCRRSPSTGEGAAPRAQAGSRRSPPVGRHGPDHKDVQGDEEQRPERVVGDEQEVGDGAEHGQDDRHRARPGPPREQPPAGEGHQQPDQQVDPAPGGGVELEQVVAGGRRRTRSRRCRRAPATSCKTPTMIIMIAANKMNPTAPAARLPRLHASTRRCSLPIPPLLRMTDRTMAPAADADITSFDWPVRSGPVPTVTPSDDPRPTPSRHRRHQPDDRGGNRLTDLRGRQERHPAARQVCPVRDRVLTRFG